jgi:preprotein translocase subunit SecY
LLDVFNLLAGGAIGGMAIFALGIMPYISSSIIIQLMATVSPRSDSSKGARAQADHQYTRYGTVMLAAVQACAIAIGLEQWGPLSSQPVGRSYFDCHHAGWRHHLLMWQRQITARGVGNGISLIIMAGIVAHTDLSGPIFEQAAPAPSIHHGARHVLTLCGVGCRRRLYGARRRSCWYNIPSDSRANACSGQILACP